MGTNFYWIIPHPPEKMVLPTGDCLEIPNRTALHIGKRSAAGFYCWDCRQTLCTGGEAQIHFHSEDKWHKECPTCGTEARDETLVGSSAGLELGIASAETRVPTGVHSVSSFSWAQDPEKVKKACADFPETTIVEDEYGSSGTRYTGKGFLKMLECNCPVQFTHSLGQDFC